MKTIAMYAWYWFKNILLALDQLLNVLLWGDPDETLSRRAGRARDKKLSWGCRLCSILDAIDPRHCQKTLDRVAKNGKKATGFKLPKLPQWAMIAIWVLSSSGLTAGGVYYVMHDTVVAKKVYKAKKVRAYR
jgi:hypothetical protein